MMSYNLHIVKNIFMNNAVVLIMQTVKVDIVLNKLRSLLVCAFTQLLGQEGTP